MPHFAPRESLTPEQLAKVNNVRQRASTFADLIHDSTPMGPNRDECIDLLEHIVMVLEHEVSSDRPPMLTTEAFGQAMVCVERWDKRVVRIYMNAYAWADLRKSGSPMLDQASRSADLKKGIMGVLFNVEIRCSKLVPIGTLIVLEESYTDDLLAVQMTDPPDPTDSTCALRTNPDWKPDLDRAFSYGFGASTGIPLWNRRTP